MKIVYGYGADGLYSGHETAFEDPLNPGSFLLPVNTTDVEPLKAGVNQAAVWASGAWTLVPDYRGWTGYDDSGKAVVITAIGQEPAPSWTTTPPLLTGNNLLLSQIETLESAVSDRRIREAVLGTDNGWLKNLDAQIADLRAKLTK